MRLRSACCVIASTALGLLLVTAPDRTTAHAQAGTGGAGGPAGPGSARSPAGTRTRAWTGEHPDVPGPACRDGGARDRPVHVEELLPGQDALDGQTIFPLQHAAADHRHLDVEPHRRQSSGLRLVERLLADYPREKIVSPYPYKTAKEHYEALLAQAKAKGGPTVYTRQNPARTGTAGTPGRRPTRTRSGSGAPSTRPPRSSPCSRPSIRSAWCR